MFKSASQRQGFIARTGSYATRIRGRGDNPDVPGVPLQEPREQRLTRLMALVRSLRKEVQPLRNQAMGRTGILKPTCPMEVVERWQALEDRLEAARDEISDALRGLPHECHFAMLFIADARNGLSKGQFFDIMKDVREGKPPAISAPSHTPQPEE